MALTRVIKYSELSDALGLIDDAIDAANSAAANASPNIPTVTSVAQLKAIDVTGLGTGTRVDTTGYYSSGDGGNNSFYYDTTSLATTNNGTVIRPDSIASDAIPGRWLAVNTTVLNPNQFGAYGNGSTDDTAAIQAMFTAAGTASRYFIHFLPTKTYRTTTGITITYDAVTADVPRVIFGYGSRISMSSSVRGADVLKFNLTGNSSFRGLQILGLELSGGSVLADTWRDGNGNRANYNPPSLANGASTTTTLPISGCLTTDTIAVWFNGQALPTNYTMTGACLVDGTVTVTVTNNSGGTVDLASGTLCAYVTNGACHGLHFNADNVDGTNYFYKWTIRDVRVTGVSGDGIRINGLTFEGSINNCFVDKGETGFNGNGIRIRQDGALNPSSIDIIACQTRGGINGMRLDGNIENTNIYGGTTLYTAGEGIIWTNCRGAIDGVHVERSNNQEVSGNTSDTAGINVGGQDFTVKNCYIVQSDQRARYGIKAFVSSGNGTLMNNSVVTIVRKYFLDSSESSGSILVIGDNPSSDIVVDGATRVTYITDRVTPNILGRRSANFSSAVSITPDFRYGTVYQIQNLATNTTINAPSNASNVVGNEIVFSIQQNGTGGYTVTWDSVYARSATPIGSSANQITLITFMYIEGKWREKSLVVTT